MKIVIVASAGFLTTLSACSGHLKGTVNVHDTKHAAKNVSQDHPLTNLKYVSLTTNTCLSAPNGDACEWAAGIYTVASKVKALEARGNWTWIEGRGNDKGWIKSENLIQVAGTELAVQKGPTVEAPDQSGAVLIGEAVIFVTSKNKNQCQVNNKVWVDCSSLSFDPKRIENIRAIEHYNAQRRENVQGAKVEYDQLMARPIFLYKSELERDGESLKEDIEKREEALRDPDFQECFGPAPILDGLP